MSDPYIHHFDPLLKEQELEIERLTVLMHQAFIAVESVRRKHLLITETYEDWCGDVNK